MKIIGAQIQLRPITLKDADSITKNVTPETARFSTVPYPYRRSDAVVYINDSKAKMKKGELVRLGIEDRKSKSIIGMVGLENINQDAKNAEIGYWLGKDYWGKGIMSEAVQLMTAYGFKTLKLKRIYARVFAPNIASSKLLEKIGYKKEGELRKHLKIGNRYLNELHYGLLSTEYSERTNKKDE